MAESSPAESAGRIAVLTDRLRAASPAGRGPALEALADAYIAAGKPRKAVSCLDQAWAAGHRTAALRRKLGVALMTAGQELRALEVVPDPPPADADPLERGRLLLTRSRALTRAGRLADAESAARRALAQFQMVAESGPEQATCYNGLAVVLFSQGRYRDAIAPLERSIQIARQSHDSDGELRSEHNRALVDFHTGDYEGALRRFRRALAEGREHGLPLVIGGATSNIARIEHNQGRSQQAWQSLQEAQRNVAASGDEIVAGYVGLTFADIAADTGSWAAARRQASRYIERFREIGDPRMEAFGLLILARADEGEGRHAEAVEKASRALELAAPDNLRELRGLALRTLGLLEADGKSPDGAIRRLAESVAVFRSAGIAFDEAVSRTELAGLLLRAGRREEATAEIAQARPIFERAESPKWLDRLSALGDSRDVPSRSTRAPVVARPEDDGPSLDADSVAPARERLDPATEQLTDEVRKAQGAARGPVLEQLGDRYREAGRLVKALACYEHAWDAGHRNAGVRRKYASALMAAGKPAPALALLEEEPDPRTDPLEYGRFLVTKGRLLWRVGHHEEAESVGGRALDWLVRSGASSRDTADAYNLQGIIRIQTGRYPDAVAPLEKARDIAVTLGDEVGRLRAEGNLGSVAVALGNYDEAVRSLNAVLEDSRRCAAPIQAGVALANRALVEQNRGQLDQAKSSVRQAQRLMAEAGDQILRLQLDVQLADVAADSGEWTLARAEATKALQEFRQIGDRRHEAASLCVLARADRARGNPAPAMEQAVLAVNLTIAEDLRENKARALRLLGTIEAEHGDTASGLRRIEESISFFRLAGMIVEEAISRAEMAVVLAKAGKSADARRHVEQARAVFAAVGAKGWLARTAAMVG